MYPLLCTPRTMAPASQTLSHPCLVPWHQLPNPLSSMTRTIVPLQVKISIIPCAAPERSTELCSVVSVCINHGTSSSKPLSPMPRTIVPRARADAVRTSGTGSSSDCLRPGIIVGRYGDRSYIQHRGVNLCTTLQRGCTRVEQ